MRGEVKQITVDGAKFPMVPMEELLPVVMVHLARALDNMAMMHLDVLGIDNPEIGELGAVYDMAAQSLGIEIVKEVK